MNLLNFFGPDLIFKLLAFVVGMVLHEFGHAVAALLVGDDTAKRQGRVTLNPLAHLDPLGLILILFANFGWARPVMFDPRNIRINKRLGIILISLAGPFMNALVAWASIEAFLLLNPTNSGFWVTMGGTFLQGTLSWMITINILLAVFNLIPVPPLDGWKVFLFMLPRKTAMRLAPFERLGPFLLVLLLITPIGSLILGFIVQSVLGWFGLA